MGMESLKTFLVFISISFAASVAYNYYNNRKKKVPREVHEVMMFSQGIPILKKSKYSRCSITHNMDRLLHHLSSTKKTLDVCMYVLTNMDLTNTVLKLHYRGVKVRFIIDADMAYATGSHIRRLEKQGIPVRWRKSEWLMHHKFCLIDGWAADEALPMVMMGSLNWTTQALDGNWENVTVTSQDQLVEQFKAEFERLWELFTPIVKF